MAISLAAKTELALSSPTTVTLPSGTTAGDYLVLIAFQNTTSSLSIGAADWAKWWTLWRYGTGGSSSCLIGLSRFVTGQTAPVITSTATGSACLYRYTGVGGAVDVSIRAGQNASNQTMPYMSGANGQEIIWIGMGYRGSTPAPTITMDRGTGETNQNSSFTTLRTYRESLSGSVSGVVATMTITNTPTTVQSAAILLTPDTGGAWVYKGRDSSSSDTTGAA